MEGRPMELRAGKTATAFVVAIAPSRLFQARVPTQLRPQRVSYALPSRRRVAQTTPQASYSMKSPDDEDSSPSGVDNEAVTPEVAPPEDGGGDASAPADTSDDRDATTVDASVRDVPVAELKREFFTRVAGLNRGLVAAPNVRKDVVSLIEQLEQRNPTAQPTTSELLLGKWRLVFTTALDVLSLALLSPMATVSNVYQNVAVDGDGKVDLLLENVVQLEPLVAPVSNLFVGRTMTQLTVKADGTRVDDMGADLVFSGVTVRQELVVGMEIPTGWPGLNFPIGSPVGRLQTTYLDSEMRVGRAPTVRSNLENIFVLVKEDD